MKYNDTPRRLRFKASETIREKYADKPIIVLYEDEVETILTNIINDGSIQGFEDWVNDWEKFIFNSANFVIKPRKKKGEVVYAAYSIIKDKIKVTVFDKHNDDSVICWVNPDDIDMDEMMAGIETIEERWVGKRKSPPDILYTQYSMDLLKDFVDHGKALNDELDSTRLRTTKEIMADKTIDDSMKRIELKIVDSVSRELEDKFKRMRKRIDNDDSEMWLEACAKLSIAILVSLYYFHVRTPHIYLDPVDAKGVPSGKFISSKEIRTPVRKLTSVTVIRPKTGTKAYFERKRHTESWDVKGHERIYKSDRFKNMKDQKIWIKPQVRGLGKKRLAIYVEGANSDLVEDIDMVKREERE
jgi:hypothetical protein